MVAGLTLAILVNDGLDKYHRPLISVSIAVLKRGEIC